MSRSDLVAAFQQGSISRRSFIRGLIALGSTTAFANQMADRAVAQEVDTPDDTYDVVIVPGPPADETSGAGDRNRSRRHNGGNGGNGGNSNNGGSISNLIPTYEAPVVPVIPVLPPTGPTIAVTGQEIRSTVGDLVAESTAGTEEPPTVDEIRSSVEASAND